MDLNSQGNSGAGINPLVEVIHCADALYSYMNKSPDDIRYFREIASAAKWLRDILDLMPTQLGISKRGIAEHRDVIARFYGREMGPTLADSKDAIRNSEHLYGWLMRACTSACALSDRQFALAVKKAIRTRWTQEVGPSADVRGEAVAVGRGEPVGSQPSLSSPKSISATPTITAKETRATQLPKVVVFFGAGMSRPLGIPTSAEFFTDGCYNGFAQATTFTRLCERLEVDPKSADIEHIMRATELANIHNRTQGVEANQDDAALASLGTELQSMIYSKSMQFDRNRCEELYGNFLLNLSSRHVAELSLFTTNYDRTFEYFYAKRTRDLMTNMHPIPGVLVPRLRDGFVRGEGGGMVWREWGYRAADDRLGLGCDCPLLAKLHGSVGWFNTGGSVVEIDPEVAKQAGLSPLFVTPGFKGLPDHEAFRTARRLLEEQLASADCAIVVGFSFRDDYIGEIFERALKRNDRLAVDAVNPSDWPADSKVREYAELKRRIKRHECCFGKSDKWSWTEFVRVEARPWRVVPARVEPPTST